MTFKLRKPLFSLVLSSLVACGYYFVYFKVDGGCSNYTGTDLLKVYIGNSLVAELSPSDPTRATVLKSYGSGISQCDSGAQVEVEFPSNGVPKRWSNNETLNYAGCNFTFYTPACSNSITVYTVATVSN